MKFKNKKEGRHNQMVKGNKGRDKQIVKDNKANANLELEAKDIAKEQMFVKLKAKISRDQYDFLYCVVKLRLVIALFLAQWEEYCGEAFCIQNGN